MEPVQLIQGTAVPLDRSDVDTDQIIPAEWLKRVERTGFGEGLFDSWRKDPTFPMNQPQYRDASILVAGPNFGTGSSREHAVWALRDYGFRVVVSSRFGDIFRGNAGKGGLVTAEVEPDVVERLWSAVDEDPGLEVTVDLQSTTISWADETAPFVIDDYTKWRLLEGLDDVDLTLRHDDAISSFEATRPDWLPVTS